MGKPGIRVATLFCVASLLVAGAVVLLRPPPSMTITAEFSQASGIYPGSDVAVLGVPVGHVIAVEPEGPIVRVTMRLPRSTAVPRGAHAWIMSPAVVGDQYVELTPVYTGGAAMTDAAVIPVERAHAPVTWDKLIASVNTLLQALGQGHGHGSIGKALDTVAGLLDGNGAAFRQAILNVTQASGIVADQLPDVRTLLETFNKLIATLNNNASLVDSLTHSLSVAADELHAQRGSLRSTLSRLSAALADIKRLVDKHGDALTSSIHRLGELSAVLREHSGDLAEILDTLPLAAANVDRAVTPDGRMRLRLDISTNFQQFAATRKLCERFPIPLCSGIGLANPIQFPPRLENPLGLSAVLGGN